MIGPSGQTTVLIYRQPIDFRNGIDGICGICKQKLNEDPFNGGMFVFTNRSRQSLKILYYDGQGFWVYHKRLSTGRFKWWPTENDKHALAAIELMVLINNGDPSSSQMQKNWL